MRFLLSSVFFAVLFISSRWAQGSWSEHLECSRLFHVNNQGFSSSIYLFIKSQDESARYIGDHGKDLRQTIEQGEAAIVELSAQYGELLVWSRPSRVQDNQEGERTISYCWRAKSVSGRGACWNGRFFGNEAVPHLWDVSELSRGLQPIEVYRYKLSDVTIQSLWREWFIKTSGAMIQRAPTQKARISDVDRRNPAGEEERLSYLQRRLRELEIQEGALQACVATFRDPEVQQFRELISVREYLSDMREYVSRLLRQTNSRK